MKPFTVGEVITECVCGGSIRFAEPIDPRDRYSLAHHALCGCLEFRLMFDGAENDTTNPKAADYIADCTVQAVAYHHGLVRRGLED